MHAITRKLGNARCIPITLQPIELLIYTAFQCLAVYLVARIIKSSDKNLWGSLTAIQIQSRKIHAKSLARRTAVRRETGGDVSAGRETHIGPAGYVVLDTQKLVTP